MPIAGRGTLPRPVNPHAARPSEIRGKGPVPKALSGWGFSTAEA
jgi:hypothetical protein